MPRLNSRSCRTASIRSGIAGGLAGEFEGASLRSAKLRGAVLTRAQFQAADLASADLQICRPHA
jgi:uncharacterized protein YjbI with pentapeptide repeats